MNIKQLTVINGGSELLSHKFIFKNNQPKKSTSIHNYTFTYIRDENGFIIFIFFCFISLSNLYTCI